MCAIPYESLFACTKPHTFSYYSAGTSATLDNQRTHVLKGSSNIIWDSSWSYACLLELPLMVNNS